MDRISFDNVVKIISFVFPSEIIRLCMANKYLRALIRKNSLFWKQICETVDRGLAKDLIRQALARSCVDASRHMEDEDETYSDAARSIEAMTALQVIRLQKAEETVPPRDRVPRMEGHSCCLLFGRYIAIVGGWGPQGTNDVYLLDGAHLPRLSSIQVETTRKPRFKYGFTAITAQSVQKGNWESENRILVFGGCTSGGYSGDVSGKNRLSKQRAAQMTENVNLFIDLYFIDLKFYRAGSAVAQKLTIQEIQEIKDTPSIAVTAEYSRAQPDPAAAAREMEDEMEDDIDIAMQPRGAATTSHMATVSNQYTPSTRGL